MSESNFNKDADTDKFHIQTKAPFLAIIALAITTLIANILIIKAANANEDWRIERQLTIEPITKEGNSYD